MDEQKNLIVVQIDESEDGGTGGFCELIDETEDGGTWGWRKEQLVEGIGGGLRIKDSWR
jgi:hypothetical protein